jgi:hypothetical protein
LKCDKLSVDVVQALSDGASHMFGRLLFEVRHSATPQLARAVGLYWEDYDKQWSDFDLPMKDRTPQSMTP